MNGYQSTFKRVEKKYLVDEKQYAALRQSLEDHIRPDQFAKSTVCNIYFDTPDSRLIRTSLEKPVYKEKLRLRSYGTPEAQSEVFLELKKKYKGVVYKRRADLLLKQAQGYLYEGIRPEVIDLRINANEQNRLKLNGTERNSLQTNGPKRKSLQEAQVLKEIDWFLHYYGDIGPAMYLSYERTAFCGAEDGELRITFDTHILYRTVALELSAGMWGSELLEPDQRLMEIKIPGAIPLWLSQRLSQLQIYPVSFSKYGQAYLKTLTAESASLAEMTAKVTVEENVGVQEGGRSCA